MKSASSILYLIGNILNGIGIVVCLLLGIIVVAGAGSITEVPSQYTGQYTVQEYQQLAKAAGVFLLIYAVICIIIFILASRARKAVNNGSREYAPHIIMIVVGVIGTNLLYLIGGILGVVAESQESNNASNF